jgi:HTH-type transcriptional regulator/antitoxin HigA
MPTRTPAEVFPPGEFIKDELVEREWTQADLAGILGRPIQAVNEIVAGKKAITPETACGLGDAFGTGPEVWLNLENAFRLSLTPAADEDVGRRARLYELAPVKEMIRRRWLPDSNSVGQLEEAVLGFLEMSSTGDTPSLTFAAKKSGSYAEESASQRAWCYRAKHLAESSIVESFTRQKLIDHLADFRELARETKGVQRVPNLLGQLGIRFVVVEHLKSTRIDGAALWLDDVSPVVAMSLRYDRIDNFWFVLAHELAHVRNGDRSVDSDLVGTSAQPTEEKPEVEKKADRLASSLLIRQQTMQAFIDRHRPRFSKAAIRGFADRVGVHPGIVVGQLQYRKAIGYSHSREVLVPVRDLVTEVAITDGWE